MSSMPCNHKHLAHQESQHEIQKSLLGEWMIQQLETTTIALRHSSCTEDLNKLLNTSSAWQHKCSKLYDHWLALDPTRSFRQRQSEECNVYTTHSKPMHSRLYWYEAYHANNGTTLRSDSHPGGAGTYQYCFTGKIGNQSTGRTISQDVEWYSRYSKQSCKWWFYVSWENKKDD